MNRTVLVVRHVVQTGHIRALDLRRRAAQIVLAGLAALAPALQKVDRLVNRALAVAQREHVHKRRQRLRVKRARTAADHERAAGSVLRIQRNPRQLQRGKDVRVAHFILKRDAENVEFADRRARLQRKQWNALLLHQRFHIRPRRTHALAVGVHAAVQRVIQYFHAQMRHGNLVHVRKQERVPHVDALRILFLAAKLAAQIARRLLHPAHQAVNFLRKLQTHSSRKHRYTHYILSRFYPTFEVGLLNYLRAVGFLWDDIDEPAARPV